MNPVLIADDNEINRDLIAWQLDALGVHCTTVSNGREALLSCAENTYALVCMDLNLGDTDGYSVTRELRSREAQKRRPERTPIVAITAHTGFEQYQRCMSAGMDDFLSKPIALVPLAKTMVRWGVQGYDVQPVSSAVTDALCDADASSDVSIKDNALPLLEHTAAHRLRTLARKAGQPDLVSAIVDDFIERSGAHLRRLQTAFQRDQHDKVRLERFALAKNARGVGATRLVALLATYAPRMNSDSVLATPPGHARDQIERMLTALPTVLEDTCIEYRRHFHE